MRLDPQNFGLYTLVVELSAIWAEIWLDTFSSNGGTNLHKNSMWDILTTF